MTFIKQKAIFLSFFCLLIWLSAPLFYPESLHAAENPERQNQATSGNMMVADSLSETGGLKNTILFTAKDSVIYNLDRRSMELWGKANVEHDDTIVKAPKIVIDLDTSLLHAFGNRDSSVTPFEPALFTDRRGSINAETMTYNFKTGRGETSGVISSSNGINFTGEHVTRLENGDLIVRDGTFTTCNEEEPHFWFSSSRMTINSVTGVVARPLIMYIRPEIFSQRLPALPILALPYMVFPVKTGRTSGLLIPHISSHDKSRFLSNFGYFWAINDYSDLRVEGDIALNGSWRLGERFRYTKLNAFSGEIAGEYKQYPLFTDWNAKIVHNQVFDPSMRIDANLQFQGAPQDYNLNSVNSETIVTQQSNARAALAKTFNDENSIAALFYNRSEELSTLDLSQSVGTSFYQNRMYPFRSVYPVDDWRSNLSMTAGANFVSQFSSQNAGSSTGYSATINGELGYYHQFAPGSKALFTQGFSLQGREPDSGLFDDTYSGTSIMLPFRMQSTLFRYLNLNPSITFVHSLHPDGGYDNFSTTIMAVDASTRLYGVVDTGFLDKFLGLKALRHTFIPTITYAWNPSFSGSGYDSYHHLYDWPYENSINGAVPEGQSTVGLSLKNLFHGKFSQLSLPLEGEVTSDDHSKQLFSLTVSTGYNLAAEALNLLPLTIMASSNVLSNNVLFNAGSMYDFYSFDPLTGVRINRLNSEDRKGLLRFVKGFLDMSLSVQGSKQGASKESSSRSPLLMNTLQTFFNMGDFRSIDYSLPWELRFSLFLQEDRSNPLEPETISLINAAAKASLSKNWQIALNTGYDLQNGELVLPRLQLYRNLHCWQMSVQWVPFGQFQSYAFQIGLKAPE